MKSINTLSAIDFGFFRCFTDVEVEVYKKFSSKCPKELEGIQSVKGIIDAFKDTVLDECSFVAICNSIKPVCDNITICTNFFDTDKVDTDEREEFKKKFNFYSNESAAMKYSDCIIYSENPELANEFLGYSISNNILHSIKNVSSKDIIKTMLDVYYEFFDSVMDIEKTRKSTEIPWEYLPCLPVYLGDGSEFSTFDMSFNFDDNGQTYINRYDEEFTLIERIPYKKVKELANA